MQRVSITPRPNWKDKVEKIGFSFHSEQGEPYWDESAYYKISQKEVDAISDATRTLWKMYLTATNFVISQKAYKRFGIPDFFIPIIESSWKNSWPYIYGRFDLAYKNGQIKLIEFNPDTASSLYEASVVQWFWKQECFPESGQFNTIESALIKAFTDARDQFGDQPLYFSSLKEFEEDVLTVCYIGCCAGEAGINTRYVAIEDLGWSEDKNSFVDLYGNKIQNLFKFYPYEWITQSEFAHKISADKNTLCMTEPPWKMLLSSKAMLPILWELYPGHKYLLPAFYDPFMMNSYAQKPYRSRQGQGILLVKNGKYIEQSARGAVDHIRDCIYQKLFELPKFDNNYMLIGSWIVGDEAAGIGIRESTNRITDKRSRFVPHLTS